MSTVADKVEVALELNTSQFQNGLTRAQAELSTFSIAIGSMFGNILGGVVQELFRTIPRVFDVMKEDVKALDDLNKRTGASVEDISAWGNAVEVSGGSAKAFQNTISRMYNDLSRISVTGRGRSKPFLEALGIDVSSLSGKPVFELLEDISKAVEGMDKQKSSNILKNLGFDIDTIKFLQSGRKNVTELIAKQKEWGVYTEKDTEAIDKMDKAVKRVRNTLKTTLIPIFTTVVTSIAKVAVYFERAVILIRNNAKVLRGIVLGIALLFSGKLLDALIGFFNVLSAHPFMKVIIALGLLVLALEDLWTYANNGESALEGVWEKIGTPEEVLEGFNKVGKLLGSIADFFSDDENQAVAFFTLVMGLIGFLVSAIGAIPVAIAAAVAFLIAYGGDIAEEFRVIGRMILSIFEMAGTAIGDALSSAADVAKNAWNGFISWLEEKWNWIKSLLPDLTSIAEKLPSIGNSLSLSRKGDGGGSNNTTNIKDDRVYHNTFTEPVSAKRAIKEMGYSSQANRGSK